MKIVIADLDDWQLIWKDDELVWNRSYFGGARDLLAALDINYEIWFEEWDENRPPFNERCDPEVRLIETYDERDVVWREEGFYVERG